MILSGRSILSITFIILFVIIVQTGFGAQLRPSELAPDLDSLFASGNFEDLELQTLQILRLDSPDDTTRFLAAYLYLGFVLELSNRSRDAEKEYQNALSLMPSLSLDPIYVPPRLYETFENVRLRFQNELTIPEENISSDLQDSEAQLTEISPTHRKRDIALNLILPGGGFLVENKSLRGGLWIVLQGSAVAGLAYSFSEMQKAEDEYLKETNPALIEDKYDSYNLLYKNASTWAIGAGVIYILAQTDYQLSSRPLNFKPVSLGSTGDGFGFELTFSLPILFQ